MALSSKKFYTVDEARASIQRYCVAQERSQKQVLTKLREYGLKPAIADEILIELIQTGFINESRFAAAYASGKSRINGWGVRKIEAGLRSHGISEVCIKNAIQALNPTETEDLLQNLAQKKWNSLKGEGLNIRKQKTIRFLLGKGYDWSQINSVNWDL